MPEESSADLLPISALQHFNYCPRQCALIHVEGLWAENVHTVEGGHLHEQVDKSGVRARDGVRTARGLWICSHALGLIGRADAVEFPEMGPPRPVEYKRGRPKSIQADRIQLCAQAMCLEEMLAVEVPEGDLFYGRTRRREIVPLTLQLRALTTNTVEQLRNMLTKGETPSAEYHAKKCGNCSLKDLCLPQGTRVGRSPSRYFARALKASLATDLQHEP